MKTKNALKKALARKAGQRLQVPPSGPKYDLAKEIVRVSHK